MNSRQHDPDDIHAMIEILMARVGALEKFVDKNDADIRDNLGVIKVTVTKLQTYMYGSSDFRLKGIGERLENVEKCVREIGDERRSERDKLKGIQIALGITGITGLTTLGTIITQIFTK